MSVDLFYQSRQVGGRADKAGSLSILDEMLILTKGEIGTEHDSFPGLCDQVRGHIGPRFGGQFLPDHLLSLIRMGENPFSQFAMSLGKLSGQLTLRVEELHTGDEHRDAFFRLLDEDFAPGIALQTRDPWFDRPDRVELFALE